jgi:Sec-independent protein translocase protein TatA
MKRRFSAGGTSPGLLIVIILVVLFFFFKLLKATGKWLGIIKPPTDNADPEQQKKEIEKVPTPGTLPKQPQAYISIANQLEQAMNHSGTDETTIFKLLQPLQTNELIQVYKDFGIRRNYVFGVEFVTGDLFQWFQEEFSGWFDGDSLDKLKAIYKPTGLWS